MWILLENMRQKYYHYKMWEDWKNGMYRNVGREEKIPLIKAARELLSDPIRLFKVMSNVVRDWKISAEVNLTNLGENRRAWLGQAACCYACNVPEDLTRAAWNMLDLDIRIRANEVATRVIKNWEGENKDYLERGDQLCLKFL